MFTTKIKILAERKVCFFNTRARTDFMLTFVNIGGWRVLTISILLYYRCL